MHLLRSSLGRHLSRFAIVLQLNGLPAGAPAASAQETPLRVDRFGTDHGLASNTVAGIVQDGVGFIWVATRYGLQRFDGRSFVSYSSLSPGAPGELSGPIGDLAVDRRGHVWAFTRRALFRIDPVSRATARVPIASGFNGFVVDSAGRAWWVENGRLKWADVDRQPTIVRAASWPIDLKFARVLLASRRGELWIVRDDTVAAEIIRYDPISGAADSYHIPSWRFINALFEDTGGRVWLSATVGLAVLDPGAQAFRPVQHFERGLSTTRFASDDHDGVVVASDYWLLRINSSGIVTERWSAPDVFGRGVLPSRLLVDREGAHWLGTTTAGLLRLSVRQSAFKHYSSRSLPPIPFRSDFVMAVRELADGTLWVGTLRGGAYRISPDWDRVTAFLHDPRDPGSSSAPEVWDFEEDRLGNVWASTNAGLCKFDGVRFRCVSLQDVASADIAKDSAGHFWLALTGANEIISFDPATERYSAPIPLPPGVFTPIALYADPDSGYLWIVGNGIARARIEAGRLVSTFDVVAPVFENFPATSIHLYRDRQGGLWLGSQDGLNRWDAKSGRFEIVDAPGLRATTVFSVVEDARGRIWLGTAQGLVHYSPRTGTTRWYTAKDGFLSGEANRRAAILRRNGEVVIGGVHGLTQFDPDVITAARDSAPVFFTRWRKFTSRGAVDEPIDGRAVVRLNPGDRAFTIEFTALTFAPSIGRRFRYQLAGLNSDWIETTEPVATFQKPRAGRYDLHVQTAVGAEGGWSQPGATVRLDVISPFWATTWFRALALLSFVALVWTAHRARLRQAVAAEQLRVRISRDLHDEIGAGLSSIALISDAVGSDSGVSDGERTQLAQIGDVARGLVADLRDIIWAIDPDRDRLTDIVTRMKDVAAALLPGVNVTFVVPAADELAARVGMSARRDLFLLYKEILHNIAKHAHADAVLIELFAQPDRLTLTISDNGRGFDFSAGNGSGTGLKSARERPSRLGGALEVSSPAGGGTSVRLSLMVRGRPDRWLRKRQP